MAKDNIIEVLPVPAPTMGVIGNVPTTMLDPRACVKCNNVRFKNGIVSTRTGYKAYGTYTAISSSHPIAFFRFQRFNGKEYEILATQDGVYYNKDGVWTAISEGSDVVKGSFTRGFGMASIQNYFVYSDGYYAPKKWDGASLTNLSDGKTTNWSDYRPYTLLPYKFRLCGFNDKGVIGTPIRMIYSVAGDFDNVNDTGSGYIDITDGMGVNLRGAALMGNWVGVYKDYSCILMSYIGGASTFALNVQIDGIGLAAARALANLGTYHIFLGSDLNVHKWNGGRELVHIGDPIKDEIRSEIKKAWIDYSFMVVNHYEGEVHLVIPIDDTSYPKRMWTWNIREESWSRGTLAATTAMGSVVKDGVERTLLARSTDPVSVYHYDYETLTDKGDAISTEFETGDFVIDKVEHLIKNRRFFGLGLDLKGYSTSSRLTLEYSIDEGENWLGTSEKELTAAYALYDYDFLKTTRKVRFRFRDATSGQKWYLRFYGIKQKERERK